MKRAFYIAIFVLSFSLGFSSPTFSNWNANKHIDPMTDEESLVISSLGFPVDIYQEQIAMFITCKQGRIAQIAFHPMKSQSGSLNQIQYRFDDKKSGILGSVLEGGYFIFKDDMRTREDFVEEMLVSNKMLIRLGDGPVNRFPLKRFSRSKAKPQNLKYCGISSR